jgi:hypothetical protein
MRQESLWPRPLALDIEELLKFECYSCSRYKSSVSLDLRPPKLVEVNWLQQLSLGFTALDKELDGIKFPGIVFLITLNHCC